MRRGRRNHSFPDSPVTVTDAAGVSAVVDAVRSSGRFAFDAEFVGEDSYAADVCLVQAATDDAVYLIDPMAGVDLAPFWALLTAETIETIVHAGQEDLAICYHHTGRVPRCVFDIQIAAGLVGPDYPLSLTRLARSALGVRLHKSQTLTDWRRRPLSAEQTRYAVEDVCYVPAIRDELHRKLCEMDRREWADEEFGKLSDETLYEPQAEALVRRVRGAGTLNGRSMAIVQEVALERERLAEEFNRPPRVLLKDHLLVAIARNGWTQPAELKSLRGLTLTGQPLQRICAAVQRGINTPEDSRPQPPDKKDDTPWETSVSRFVTAVLHDFCRCNDLAFQLMGNSRDVRAAVLAQLRGAGAVPPGALQSGWRERFVGGVLRELLSGDRSVRIANTRQPRLELH